MAVDYIALSAYLDGEITDESERRAVERLLEESPVYAEEFARIRGARSLMQSELMRPTFHRSLMARVQELEDNGTFVGPGERVWWRAAGLSAVLAAALAAGDYTGLLAMPDFGPKSPQSQPAQPVVAPDLDGFAWGDLRDNAEKTRDTALAETALPLILRATAGGEHPVAVIANCETGHQDTYRVGEQVMPGVRLADVRFGQVVLEHAGESELLATDRAKGPVDVDGEWRLRWNAPGMDQQEVICTVREDRGLLYLSLSNGAPFATGRIENGHVFLDLPADGGTIRIEGDCCADEGEIILTGILPTGNADEPHYKVSASAARVGQY